MHKRLNVVVFSNNKKIRKVLDKRKEDIEKGWSKIVTREVLRKVFGENEEDREKIVEEVLSLSRITMRRFLRESLGGNEELVDEMMEMSDKLKEKILNFLLSLDEGEVTKKIMKIRREESSDISYKIIRKVLDKIRENIEKNLEEITDKTKGEISYKITGEVLDKVIENIKKILQGRWEEINGEIVREISYNWEIVREISYKIIRKVLDKIRENIEKNLEEITDKTKGEISYKITGEVLDKIREATEEILKDISRGEIGEKSMREITDKITREVSYEVREATKKILDGISKREIELLAKLITDRDSDRIIEGIPAVFKKAYNARYPVRWIRSVDGIREYYSQHEDILITILKQDSKNKNWEVIGTGSVMFEFEDEWENLKRGVVELGRVAVDPKQKAMGCEQLLLYTGIKSLEVLHEEGVLNNIHMLFSEPSALAPVTQHTLWERAKLVPFGMIPKYITGKKREWVLLCYAPFPSGGKLFLPDLKRYEKEIPKEIADFWYYLSGEKSSDGSKPPYVVESIIEEEGDLYIKGIHGDKENNVIFANVGGDEFLKLGRVKVEYPHYMSLLIDITRVRNASDAISELLDRFLKASKVFQQILRCLVEPKDYFEPVLILEVAGRRFEPRLLEIAEEKGFGFAGFIPSTESSGKFSVVFVNVSEEEKKKLTPVIKALYPADVRYYLSYIEGNIRWLRV